jgi:hypothetical protein
MLSWILSVVPKDAAGLALVQYISAYLRYEVGI